ncbi:hypothetical protein PIIN_02679 [Serendipita indica DSM 11827]|uniref:Mediator of RNA polymerase II transcription subunit 18 n=1 Tax=Serendipita indica (strain DSM 11827) TaxID=1109443 RepID=G4TBX5_SERID|nr:hypothetical protein PIIN_02679 [Serendipita indica DSM 11827]
MAAKPAVTSYEVFLTGSFPASDKTMLREVENRLSLHTDTSFVLHRQDYDFALGVTNDFTTLNAANLRGSGQGAPLRVKRDLTAVDGRSSEWTLHTYLKPTPTYTTAAVRSCCSIPLLSGDALSFASAMGYKPTATTTRKGYTFLKGSIVIMLYQLVTSPAESNLNPWNIEVTHTVTIDGVRNARIPAATLIKNSVDNVVAVAVLMKGLVDLRPPKL